MRKFHNSIASLACVFGFFLMIFTLNSCYYCTQLTLFHYWPSWTNLKTGGWKYRCKIYKTNCPTKWYRRPGLRQRITISVWDRNDKSYLENDEFEFVASNVEPKILWNIFEEMRVILIEHGVKYAEDEYNIELTRKGPRTIAELKYEFNAKEKKFILVKMIKGENDTIKKIEYK